MLTLLETINLTCVYFQSWVTAQSGHSRHSSGNGPIRLRTHTRAWKRGKTQDRWRPKNFETSQCNSINKKILERDFSMSNKDWIMAAVSEELQLSIEFVVNKQGEHSVNGTSISQNNSNYHTLQSLWKHSRWDIRIVYWKAGIVICKQCTRRSKQSKDLQPVISEDSSPSSSQAVGQSSAKKPRHSANSDPLQPNIIQSLPIGWWA